MVMGGGGRYVNGRVKGKTVWVVLIEKRKRQK